jgi:hypothetical protein
MESTPIANAKIRKLVVRSLAHVLGTSSSYRSTALGALEWQARDWTGNTLAPARLAKLANLVVGELGWPDGGSTLGRMLVATPALQRLSQRVSVVQHDA